jgi:hypothetical protein
MKFNEQGDILLGDEFNGSVSTLNDFIINDSYDRFCNDDDEYIVDKCSVRQNQDKVLTARGKHIIDLCIQSRLRLLNGRTPGDTEGKFTLHNSLGSHTIDYIITSESFLHRINFMKVHNFRKSLYDHCCLSVCFKVNLEVNNNSSSGKS